MKTIGLLGGASWISTAAVYQWLNQEVNRHLGGYHSARIILYSIDYAPIKNLYHQGWDKIPSLFKKELEIALSLKPDCLLLACNTLHKAFDLIRADITLSIPFFHAIELTHKELLLKNPSKVLFIGTSFTMEDDYFIRPLSQTTTIIVLPNKKEKEEIQEIQSKLSQGENNPRFRNFFCKLLEKYEHQGCQGVVLACTELPLIVDISMTSMILINPLQLQCEAAIIHALHS
jgi:aspartate racemase